MTSTLGMWNGQSWGSLATMTIGTGPPTLGLSGLDDQQVGVVGEDAQEDGVDDAVYVQLVQQLRRQRVRHQRVGLQDVARLPVVAAQDDKVAGRGPADVVRIEIRPELAGVTIKESGAESSQDWDAAGEVLADQVGGQVFHAHGAAQA